MRILLISFSEHYTFQETIYNLQKELLNSSETELWTMGTKKINYETQMTEKNILVDCPPRPGITKGTFNFKKLFEIVKTIDDLAPDVIMFHSSHAWNLFLMFTLKKKYQICHVIHDVIPHEGDKQESFVYYYNWITARYTDMVVLHSEQFIEQFSQKYNYPSSRIKYTPLWRKYEGFLPLKHSGRCLFFGRINYYKGIDYLLDIVKKCPEVQFDIVGRVDEGLDNIVKQFENFPNVHLNTTYVDGKAMRDYFENADWVLLPYKSATQSGVVIDAYCFSRPVIAFDVGALGEQIKQGVTGYLVNSGDTDEFVSIIKNSTRLSDLEKNKLSYNAWKYGFDKYSMQKGAQRLIKLFNN